MPAVLAITPRRCSHNAPKGDPAIDAVIRLVDGIVPVMVRRTGYVMRLAPFGVFGALAS